MPLLSLVIDNNTATFVSEQIVHVHHSENKLLVSYSHGLGGFFPL